MKLELARAGSHGGVNITPEDLLSMARNFVSGVPVTIGHESDDSMPAYGWVRSLEVSADGTVLIGEIELGADLSEAFEQGRYKNWSIGAARGEDDSLYLHHVAFLGAVPPMIKGLQVIEMGDRNGLVTFTSLNCGFVMSDSELSEFSRLKNAERADRIKKLSEAASGKLPIGRKEALLSFADKVEKEHPGLNFSGFMADIFSSVKPPVSQGAMPDTSAFRPQRIFSKI